MTNRLFIFLLLLLSGIECAFGASSFKFNKKAAEKVWSTRNDLFDPKAEIPDSLRQGASAVFIADYYNITANREFYSTPASETNRMRRMRWNRRMVKLFDQKAIEEFSEHEFGNRVRLAVEWFTFGGTDSGFGARIHKPDGSVVDVNIKEAIAVTEGKKGKDAVSQKIVIPGLEPGDVLEYFDYSEEWIEDFDLPDVQIVPFDEYPVARLVIEGDFSPELTVEYRTYNGFPLPEQGGTDKGRNALLLELSGIGTLTDKQFLCTSRQMPFLRLSTLNNTSSYRYYPSSVRRGGMYRNVAPGTIYRDIKNTLTHVSYDDVLGKKVKKLVGAYLKTHPEVAGHDLVDLYWLAGEYVNKTDEKCNFSDYGMAVMMSDLINKLKITDKTATVGFLNSRDNVPTKEIMSWRQPNFGMLVGDTMYMETGKRFCVPGQLPGEYQGEEGATFLGDRKQLSDLTLPTTFTMPVTKSHENKFDVAGAVILDVDNNKAAINAELTATGASKAAIAPLTNTNEWIAAVEKYLDIPEKQRYVDKSYDPEERRKEVAKAWERLISNMISDGAKISLYSIVERGILPGEKKAKLVVSATVEDCLSEAGDELLFNVGKFVGNNMRIDGTQRQRQLDVVFNAPHQISYDLVFEIPSGYEIDKNSLENLQVNINNKYGTYVATAALNDDGKLELRIRERYKTYVVPVDQWSEVLEIFDASSAYNDAVVVLKRV